MAAPTITATTVAQQVRTTVGGYTPISGVPQKPALAVYVTFTQTSGTANFAVELSVDGGTTWYAATMDASAPGTGLSAGSNRLVVVDLRATFNANATLGLSDYNGSNAKVRVTGTSNNAEVGNAFTSSAFVMKTTRPSLTSAIMAQYVGSPSRAASVSAPITLAFTAGTATVYRASSNDANLIPGSSWAYAGIADTSASFTFTSADSDGYKTVWIQIYDDYYNASSVAQVQWTTDTSVAERRPWWQYTVPQNCIVTLIGSTGNSDYTGIAIDPQDQHFTPDRSVVVQVYGRSPIPLSWKVLSTSDVDTTTDPTLAANVDHAFPLDITDPTTATAKVKLCQHKSSPAADDFNCDYTATVNVTFTDAAGNSYAMSPAPAIRLNTRIYKSAFTPLRKTDATYAPVVRERSNGIDTPIPQSMILTDSVIRAWHDVFYPDSHAYPRTLLGELDTAYVLAPIARPNNNGTSTVTDGDFESLCRAKLTAAGYDMVRLVADFTNGFKWVIYRDSDGRPITDGWTTSGTKNYGNLESSNATNLRYWVFDNTGYGDFALEFEWFMLDSGIYGPPFNPAAPYKGDSLVIYDATADGALEPYVDETGVQRWRLSNDPGKGLALCTELAAYGGSGNNVVNLKNGLPVGAGAQGDFTTSKFVSTPKIVAVLYTDTSHTMSGFKVKAARSHQKIWSNYDLDELHGEVWVHKHSSIATAAGAADATDKLLTYDYMSATVDIDYDKGEVHFAVAPSGEVTADGSYYTTSTFQSNLFLATWDDLVDFQEAPIYVGQAGDYEFSSVLLSADYETSGYGRVIQAGTWDKDRGLVQFDPTKMPGANQRLFSSYYHHTMKRLSADGYGDLTFRHPVLVADITRAYPDYTWSDVKIINEGDATLEDGQLKFTFRGYDKNGDGQPTFGDSGTLDAVLDPNRPWDVQKGTKDETYTRMAMAVMTDFIWDRTCPRPDQNVSWNPPSGADARYTYNNVTARGIVGAWTNGTLDDLDPRQTFYGRCVWVLGGSGGTGYPSSTSAGPKRCSLEAFGKFYSSNVQ